MNTEEFCTQGASIFGAGWQSKLARTWGVNPRTVRRWASGETPVPPVVAAAMAGGWLQLGLLAAVDSILADVERFGLHHPKGGSAWWPVGLDSVRNAVNALRGEQNLDSAAAAAPAKPVPAHPRGRQK